MIMGGEKPKEVGAPKLEAPIKPKKKEVVPPGPKSGVSIDTEAELTSTMKLKDWKALAETYGNKDIKKFEEVDMSFEKQFEKAIREDTKFAEFVDKCIAKPEGIVNKDDVPWLRKRVELAQKPDNKEAEVDKKEEVKKESTDKPEVKKDKFNLQKKLNELRGLSNAELMQKLFSSLSALLTTFSDGGIEKIFGIGGPKFSETEIDKIKIDIDKAETEEYKPEMKHKSMEFVAKALNLPPKKTMMAFMYSLQSSTGFVYEQKKDMITPDNVRRGDVLFFRKEGETQPHLTAIVSDPGPPMMMKYMNEEGEVKSEEVLKSTHFEQDWFGLIKVPEQRKPDKIVT